MNLKTLNPEHQTLKPKPRTIELEILNHDPEAQISNATPAVLRGTSRPRARPCKKRCSRHPNPDLFAPETRYSKFETRNPEPEANTQNLAPEIQNLNAKPETLNLAPEPRTPRPGMPWIWDLGFCVAGFGSSGFRGFGFGAGFF